MKALVLVYQFALRELSSGDWQRSSCHPDGEAALVESPHIMDDPLVRHVTTSDGVHIAYWALGHGPPLIVLPALPHSHIGVEWQQPEWRRSYELGASVRTMVRYDGRGTGLSQRDVVDSHSRRSSPTCTPSSPPSPPARWRSRG